jgi:hypothetical protein
MAVLVFHHRSTSQSARTTTARSPCATTKTNTSESESLLCPSHRIRALAYAWQLASVLVVIAVLFAMLSRSHYRQPVCYY